jgi:hypothetical protein
VQEGGLLCAPRRRVHRLEQMVRVLRRRRVRAAQPLAVVLTDVVGRVRRVGALRGRRLSPAGWESPARRGRMDAHLRMLVLGRVRAIAAGALRWSLLVKIPAWHRRLAVLHGSDAGAMHSMARQPAGGSGRCEGLGGTVRTSRGTSHGASFARRSRSGRGTTAGCRASCSRAPKREPLWVTGATARTDRPALLRTCPPNPPE